MKVWMVVLSMLACRLLAQPQLGIDVLDKHEIYNYLINKRVGIITNHTGINSSCARSVDVLVKLGIDLQVIFCPEHGFDGSVPAAAEVHHAVDKKTNIPIVSLYKTATKRIPQEWLTQLDCLLFDIQDSGMRHYTYISTLMYAMQSAAQAKIQFIVLDRPNPLTGKMEGPLVDPQLISFISVASIPLRHGLTIGELALYFNKHILNNAVSLAVVPMNNYSRQSQPINLAKALSPNISTLQSCFGYSFLGILGEVKPFELGVGTPKAFKCILLPQSLGFARKNWYELDHLLQKHGIKSTWYEYFHPKKKKQFCGLELYIPQINKVRSFTVLLEVLEFFKHKGLSLTFSAEFDKAIGTPKLRQWMQGQLSKNQLKEYVNQQVSDFYKKVDSLLLYDPIITCSYFKKSCVVSC